MTCYLSRLISFRSATTRAVKYVAKSPLLLADKFLGDNSSPKIYLHAALTTPSYFLILKRGK
jgi:hypothetical protein